MKRLVLAAALLFCAPLAHAGFFGGGGSGGGTTPITIDPTGVAFGNGSSAVTASSQTFSWDGTTLRIQGSNAAGAMGFALAPSSTVVVGGTGFAALWGDSANNALRYNLNAAASSGTLLGFSGTGLTPGDLLLVGSDGFTAVDGGVPGTSGGAISNVTSETRVNVTSQTAVNVLFDYSQSTMSVGGFTITHGLAITPLTKTSNYQMLSTDGVILASSTLAASTVITLPTAASLIGQTVSIYKTDASTMPIVVKASGSDTMVSLSTITLQTYGTSQSFRSDGSATWYPIGKLVSGPSYVGQNADPTSTAVGVSSDSYLEAVMVNEPVSIKGIQFAVGVQAGNMDVGIYNASLVKLASTGSTAVPAPGVQSLNFTVPLNIQPGLYYLALGFNSSTASFARVSTDELTGFYSQTGGFPLPSTATLGTASARNYALIGLLYGGTP